MKMKQIKRSGIETTKEEPPTKRQKKITYDSSLEKPTKKTKSFVGKSKNIQTKNGKLNTNTEKPADWNLFKKEKKELRLARKKQKSLYEVIVEAKKIGENLRRKTLKGGDEERQKLTNQLHEMLGNKGQYVKLVLAHDMARIVQYLLKFGSIQMREEIAKELIPSTIELVQSKYAKFCVERMLKYGNATTRSNVIDAFYGNVVKLASHTISAHVLANAYSTWATNQQKLNLQQEFYGDMYKQNKDSEVKCIADAYKQSPDMKVAILGAVKANLDRVCNKELLDNQLVHAVLHDYLNEMTDMAQRNEMIGQMSSHAVVLANTKEGSRVLMKCIWHGTNKDKKTIMKSLKEHIKDLCCHEQAHTVIICILDSVDDTVLVNKILLNEIVSNASHLVQNEWGRKVLLWLVSAGDPHHFHPTFTAELKHGFDSSTSKKAVDVRRKELLGYSLPLLLKQIADDTNMWLGNSSVAMVTLTTLKADPLNKDLQATLKNISHHICDKNWTISEKADNKEEKGEIEQISGIEHAGLHMTLKKLAQNDKILSEKNVGFTFGSILLETLTDDTVTYWTSSNRGCFLLVAVIESNPKDVQNKFINMLKPHLNKLRQKATSGAKVLIKKIN
ncbi:protein penguin [Chrysoperla carnea]|uniref:protein penguin n=1 Tax=Chrysoperla carnea TaxID=189513 RepID=UPI001D05C2F1|nr:protein penguin [Chrysoperla carnea]